MQDKTDALWKDSESTHWCYLVSSCSSLDVEIKVVTKIEKTVVHPNHASKKKRANE